MEIKHYTLHWGSMEFLVFSISAVENTGISDVLQILIGFQTPNMTTSHGLLQSEVRGSLSKEQKRTTKF
jgi:hypothetical protein